MTVQQWAEKYCYERGMFENQAQEVVTRVVIDPELVSMTGCWDRAVEHYPNAVLITFSLLINKEALKYIDEKAPEAWFRELFV